MNNNQVSAKGAIGSVFGAVAAASGAVSSLFGTASDSVGMLNKYVADASEKQRIASDYDMATYEEKLLTTLATEEAKNNREIKTFFAEHPDNQVMWQTAEARIKAAVAARRGITQQDAAAA